MFLRKKKKTVNQHSNPLTAVYSNIHAEIYRTLRTNIQFLAKIKDVKTILMTSSQPDEGKSTILSNLGVVFAQSGNKVLLIDADLRKPSLHVLFKVSNLNGLSDFLIDQCTVEDCIVPTYIERLSVLPSGTIPPNPYELLASSKFINRLEELGEQFDYIFIDSPPILSVADPLVMAQAADGVIFLINAKKTTIPVAKKALKSLQHLNASVLGVLVNRFSTEANTYTYNYAYDANNVSRNS